MKAQSKLTRHRSGTTPARSAKGRSHLTPVHAWPTHSPAITFERQEPSEWTRYPYSAYDNKCRVQEYQDKSGQVSIQSKTRNVLLGYAFFH